MISFDNILRGINIKDNLFKELFHDDDVIIFKYLG